LIGDKFYAILSVFYIKKNKVQNCINSLHFHNAGGGEGFWVLFGGELGLSALSIGNLISFNIMLISFLLNYVKKYLVPLFSPIFDKTFFLTSSSKSLEAVRSVVFSPEVFNNFI